MEAGKDAFEMVLGSIPSKFFELAKEMTKTPQGAGFVAFTIGQLMEMFKFDNITIDLFPFEFGIEEPKARAADIDEEGKATAELCLVQTPSFGKIWMPCSSVNPINRILDRKQIGEVVPIPKGLEAGIPAEFGRVKVQDLLRWLGIIMMAGPTAIGIIKGFRGG